MPPPEVSLEASATVSSIPDAVASARAVKLHRYRWALLPIACGGALSTVLFLMAADAELWARWSAWFPYAMRPVFHDLWITLQHLREAATGLDPLSDPNSQFAYPRAVLLLRYFGLQHLPAELLGALQGAALTLGVVLVMRPFTPRRALGTSLLLFTPPMMFAIERGNLDCAMFLLCALAAWQWSHSRRARHLRGPILALTLGAILKLYPVFAMAAGAMAETGRRRLTWLLGILVVALYWYLQRDELGLVAVKIPVASSAAWGSLVFFARVEWYLEQHPDVLGSLATVNWKLVGWALYAVAAIAAAAVGFRLAPRFRHYRVKPIEWAYYWVGSVVFFGCFIGANFAYRWVIIVMTLPLLLRCARSPQRTVALWARATLATILASLAAPLRLEGEMFTVVQTMNWGCMMLLVMGCTAMRVTTKSRLFAAIGRALAPAPAKIRV